MNFDPITKAEEETDDNEQNLRLYAVTCAALDATYKTLDPESDEASNVQQAFSDAWDLALCLTNHIDLYQRIDKAKKAIGFD